MTNGPYFLEIGSEGCSITCTWVQRNIEGVTGRPRAPVTRDGGVVLQTTARVELHCNGALVSNGGLVSVGDVGIRGEEVHLKEGEKRKT